MKKRLVVLLIVALIVLVALLCTAVYLSVQEHAQMPRDYAIGDKMETEDNSQGEGKKEEQVTGSSEIVQKPEIEMYEETIEEATEEAKEETVLETEVEQNAETPVESPVETEETETMGSDVEEATEPEGGYFKGFDNETEGF